MKRRICKKLKSTRGSGIAEALVGFLISVLSVLTLLGVATTTLELIKQGDVNIERLYAEEGAIGEFVKTRSITGFDEFGQIYDTYPAGDGHDVNYTIVASGDNVLSGSGSVDAQTAVKYCVTRHHHLFGFVPN